MWPRRRREKIEPVVKTRGMLTANRNALGRATCPSCHLTNYGLTLGEHACSYCHTVFKVVESIARHWSNY